MVEKQCAKCGVTAKTPGKIYRLNTGGGSGDDFCKKCWAAEMRWRKMRNQTLTGTDKFPIRAFPGK